MSRLLRRVATWAPRVPRSALRLAYGFDSWHTMPPSQKPYVADAVRFLNSRPRELRSAAVEIGCGLGDIIRALDYGVRVGLDIDENVLRGARLLSRVQGKRVDFSRFDLLHQGLPETWDAIAILNWPHMVAPAPMANAVGRTFAQLRENGTLLIDTVTDPAYAHNHCIEQLTQGLACSIEVLGQYPRGRTVFVITRTHEQFKSMEPDAPSAAP